MYIPSPSRSVSSLTSGDLADVSSSLSRSSVSSGSLGSKIGSLSSSLDRNPSVTKHLETQISHEHSQADHGHGEAAKSSKPGAEKSNTGEIMAGKALKILKSTIQICVVKIVDLLAVKTSYELRDLRYVFTIFSSLIST